MRIEDKRASRPEKTVRDMQLGECFISASGWVWMKLWNDSCIRLNGIPFITKFNPQSEVIPVNAKVVIE